MDHSNVDPALLTIFNSKESNIKPSDKIPLITKEIEQLKADLKIFLNENEGDLAKLYIESEDLCHESISLVDDLVECKKEIEEETMAEIVKSIENYDTISKELVRLNYALNIVFDVIQCGRYVKEFDDGREAGIFTRAVEAVYDLLQFIDHPADGFQHLELYANTRHTAKLILESLLTDLFTVWDKMVSCSTKLFPKKTIVTLTLNTEPSLIIVDVLNALEQCKKLKEKISEFAQFLVKELIKPMIHCDCNIHKETEETTAVHILHKVNHKPQYLDVLNNLKTLFEYLSLKLSLEVGGDSTIMQMIAKEIQTEFRDTLVEDCLLDTVPNNVVDLANYSTITAEIEDFQSYLTTLGVYPEGSFSILNYVSEIENIFANKASQHFLDSARRIMLKDMSAMMSIGVENIPEDSQASSTDDSTESALKILEKTIPRSLFYFPRCMISKTAQELLDLVNEMMEQGVQCSEMVPRKLYHTTRMVFELYEAVVPYHHEKYLQTIPQYAALFHNNCMYLAHNLQLLGDKWCKLLKEDKDKPVPAIGFLDLVQPLRDLGYKHLADHLQYQRKQLLDNIRSSDLGSLSSKERLSESGEAAVRQCLRQLSLLNNVWAPVLPANVNTKLMATLTNMLVSELIHRVITVEDISAEMATQLATIYTLVLQKVPALFQSQSDLVLVKSWPRLHELIFVLGGSLKDIESHWTDGTGSLAEHFTTDEIRNLVKALFQNTQFRANLLAKIK